MMHTIVSVIVICGFASFFIYMQYFSDRYKVYSQFEWEDETGCTRSSREIHRNYEFIDLYWYAKETTQQAKRDNKRVQIIATQGNNFWFWDENHKWSKDGR